MADQTAILLSHLMQSVAKAHRELQSAMTELIDNKAYHESVRLFRIAEKSLLDLIEESRRCAACRSAPTAGRRKIGTTKRIK